MELFMFLHAQSLAYFAHALDLFNAVFLPARPDCSNWVPPEEFYPGGVWPDGSPVEPGAQCGIENW